MSEFNLDQKVRSLQIGRSIPAYTGVSVNAGQDSSGNERIYYAGDDSGYVLEVSTPYGSQQVADSLLAGLKLRGIGYDAYDSDGALLDPSAEIGDAVTINGTRSTILTRSVNHGRLMAATISSPFDEEVNHEYQYESKTRREFKRESAYTRARLTIAEDSIEAKVSRTGGNASSFGWILTADNHVWYADNTEVMRVDRNGLTVKGRVEATSGVIGGCTIENGVLKVGSANVTNLSIGNNFNVDSSGNMTANNATITGTLTVGGNQITAANLYTGAYQSSQNYGSWNGAAVSTSAGGYCYGGAGYGYGYNNATIQSGGSYPNYYQAESIVGNRGGTLGSHTSGDSVVILGYGVSWKTVTINGTTYYLLGR